MFVILGSQLHDDTVLDTYIRHRALHAQQVAASMPEMHAFSLLAPFAEMHALCVRCAHATLRHVRQ